MSWPVSNDDLAALGEAIRANAGGAVGEVEVAYGELNLGAEAARIVDLMNLLRDDPRFAFHQLIDLCGADYPNRDKRFDVVYHLLSLTRNWRVRVKVQTDEETPVPSIVGVYPAAGWYEREAFDLYGVFFSDHPDLRRLLTDYIFVGHPLRKDFHDDRSRRGPLRRPAQESDLRACKVSGIPQLGFPLAVGGGGLLQARPGLPLPVAGRGRNGRPRECRGRFSE